MSVLVVGAEGVGKSSLIHLLMKHQQEYKDVGKLYDTSITYIDAPSFRQDMSTQDFMKELRGKPFSLMLYVIRQGRLLETDIEFFGLCRRLFDKSIPLGMVITHCDFDNPIDIWWTENQPHVTKLLGRDRLIATSVCSISDETLLSQQQASRPIYQETRRSSINILFAGIASETVVNLVKEKQWVVHNDLISLRCV